jgi:hypothetical protein
MKQEKQAVTCPKCTAQIDVSALLHSQIEAELHQNFAVQLSQKQAQFEVQLKNEKAQLEQTLKARLTADSQAQIDAMRNELDEKSAQLREFNKAKAEIERLNREQIGLRETIEAENEAKFNHRLVEERKKTEQLLRASLEADSQAQIQVMRDELNEKSEQLREFNKAKAEIERLTREKAELTDAVKAEAALELNQKLREEKQRLNEQNEMRMRDKDFEIEKLKYQIQEAQRVAEQGLTQAQGEVQELAIEEWLRGEFPFDEIEEIKKGQRGADCIQIVHTRSRQNCGKIYYESKRTLEFGRDWIEKFKADMQAKNIHVGILVTQAMPKDMQRMGLKEGIWICTFEEFKGLSVVLRQSIIDISNIQIAQENKGEKMAMLYDFLISNEFKTNIQAIVEGFVQMEEDLNKERRTMESLWKQREKQIRKVMSNTASLYGSIRGIAGNAIQSVPQLETTTSVAVIESDKQAVVSPPKKSPSQTNSLF